MAAAAAVVGIAAPSEAQVPDPDIRSYVLFGFEELAFKGGQGNHGPSIIDGGNIGVNGLGFIRGNDFRMNICSNARMIMSDNTMVVSDTMRMGDSSTPTQECDVYEGFANTTNANVESTRTGPVQPFTAPPVKATPPFPDFACNPANNVTIPANAPPTTLPPGTYGNVNFQNGTTVTLQAGTYTMCRFTTGQNVTVNTPPGGGVVMQSEQDFLLRDNMQFDGNDCATIPIVYVRGSGLGANDNAVTMGQDSDVWGHFYSPDGKINLGNQTTLHGTFWGRAIASDFNVDVEYCEPPLPLPPTGSIEVTKLITGDVQGAPPDATFTIHYNCTLPGPGVRDALDGAFAIAAGQTLTFTDVEVGTTCTATEIDVPDPLPGYVFDAPVFDPGDTITVDEEGQTVSVVVENPLREIFGTIEVTKAVTGDTDGVAPGSEFGFALDCADDTFDDTFTLEPGQTFTSDPIRVGVECTVDETDVPDPLPGFIYRDPVFTPDPPTVTIGAENQVVTIDVDNSIVELVGRLRVHKEVTGDTGGYVEGTAFGFSLDCDNDAFDTTFELSAEQTFTSVEMPVGTTCTVDETTVPDPASGFTYQAPVFTPDPPTVTVTTAGEMIAVDVTNQLTGPTTPGPEPGFLPGGNQPTGGQSTLGNTGGPPLWEPLLGGAALLAGASLLVGQYGRRR
jgi:hypothetical protein